MGDIVESRRRHYVGLDADKDTIPGGGKTVGDSYFATDKTKQYYWNGAAWKTGLGYEYVPLRKAAVDWDQGDLTLDSAMHENALDLATKGVVAGAVAVVMALNVKDDAADKEFDLLPNQVDAGNVKVIDVLVANRWHRRYFTMVCDANLLIDYYGTTGLDSVQITVTGYFI